MPNYLKAHCLTMSHNSGHIGWRPNTTVSIQGTLHQGLVYIGLAVSEELIEMWKVKDDNVWRRRQWRTQTMTDAK